MPLASRRLWPNNLFRSIKMNCPVADLLHLRLHLGEALRARSVPREHQHEPDDEEQRQRDEMRERDEREHRQDQEL